MRKTSKRVIVVIAAAVFISLPLTCTMVFADLTETLSSSQNYQNNNTLVPEARNATDEQFAAIDLVRSKQDGGIKTKYETGVSGNIVLAIPNDQILHEETGRSTSLLKKLSVRVKLPTVARGEVHLLHYTADWSRNFSGTSSAVVIRNGGIYLKDIDANPVDYECYYPEGSLEADKWYKVVRYLDCRAEEYQMQKVVIYDDTNPNEPTLIYKSSWIKSGTMKPYLPPAVYFSWNFKTAGYDLGEEVFLDDFEMYNISDLALVITKTLDTANYRTLTLNFNDTALDTASLTKSLFTFSADNPDLPGISADNFDITIINSKNVRLTFTDLPYSEGYSISLSDRILTSDGYMIGTQAAQTFSTGMDPVTVSNVALANGAADNEKKVTFKMNNPSDRTRKYVLLFSIWNNKGRCLGMRAAAGTLAPAVTGVTAETGSVAIPADATRATVAVYDNWRDMTPIGTVIDLTLN